MRWPTKSVYKSIKACPAARKAASTSPTIVTTGQTCHPGPPPINTVTVTITPNLTGVPPNMMVIVDVQAGYVPAPATVLNGSATSVTITMNDNAPAVWVRARSGTRLGPVAWIKVT